MLFKRGSLQPSHSTIRGPQLKLQVPYSRTNVHRDSFLPLPTPPRNQSRVQHFRILQIKGHRVRYRFKLQALVYDASPKEEWRKARLGVWYIGSRNSSPTSYIVQELCESRDGRPELSVLMSLLVSVDVKNY